MVVLQVRPQNPQAVLQVLLLLTGGCHLLRVLLGVLLQVPTAEGYTNVRYVGQRRSVGVSARQRPHAHHMVPMAHIVAIL